MSVQTVHISLLKQFLIGFLLLLVILIAIEGIARFYESQELPCHFIGKDAFGEIDSSIQKQVCNDSRNLLWTEPDILRYIPDQHFDTININSYGFRGPEIIDKNSDDAFRNFIVGGSTTFGSGSTSDNETIPGQLQQFFNQHEKNVEVINAGIGSGYSYTEKFLIKNDLINLNPDLILVYTGGNDSHRPIIYPTVTVGDYGINIKDIRFWRNPFVISDLFIETTRYETTNVELDRDFINKKITFWKNNMNDICKTASENDIKTIVTLHPILATSEKIFSNDESEYMKKDDFQTTDVVLEIFNGIGTQLPQLETSCDVTADLRNIFKNNPEPIFFDEAHINNEGNKIVAQKLFEIIDPHV